MDTQELHAALLALDRPLGEESRTLEVGDLRIRLEGLDAALAAALDRRWGGFLRDPAKPGIDRVARFFRSNEAGWLGPWERGERYRIESAAEGALVYSYHFAVVADAEPAAWRVALSREPGEPEERLVENAARYLVARAAAEAGGFAMHAAGVLHEGRAWLLAGPSRSGKTTAVGLCRPAQSLGDDLGLVVPENGGWRTAAMPFDNAERIGHDPPRGWFPVAGIWRLFQAERTRIERPAASVGVASLMSCTAFPWLLPDLSGALLEQVRGFVETGRFEHLHFQQDADLRSALLGAGTGG